MRYYVFLTLLCILAMASPIFAYINWQDEDKRFDVGFVTAILFLTFVILSGDRPKKSKLTEEADTLDESSKKGAPIEPLVDKRYGDHLELLRIETQRNQTELDAVKKHLLSANLDPETKQELEKIAADLEVYTSRLRSSFISLTRKYRDSKAGR